MIDSNALRTPSINGYVPLKSVGKNNAFKIRSGAVSPLGVAQALLKNLCNRDNVQRGDSSEPDAERALRVPRLAVADAFLADLESFAPSFS